MEIKITKTTTKKQKPQDQSSLGFCFLDRPYVHYEL